ncbi:MAG: threonine synthase [Gammaproteobacteria bacterium]
MGDRYTGLINKYRDYLPVHENTSVISLGEGNTPLIRLRRLVEKTGKDVEIYAKYEGLNPTGSFKDRGMTVAVTKAAEAGSSAIICASTGNTSAAAAAYAARAGMTAFVVIPEGKIAMGKLAQALMYGAVVLQIRGNFDQGLALVRQVAEQIPVTIVNSINPYRLQGQKTAAFEIVEALGCVPDYHCLPVGNAGNISAYWMGYDEFYRHGRTNARPKMLGYQAEGAAPFVHGHPIEAPETVATAIRIGAPQSWDKALAAQQDSGGWFDQLTDDQILAAQRQLASLEGIFCEPASACSIAGALRDIAQGKIPEGSRLVCTLTGNGLKDPDIAIQQCQSVPVQTVDAERGAVERAIVQHMP